MLPLEQAIEQMLSQLETINRTEILPLQQAVARICAEDIISPINVPAFDNSAMDGYAVRLADLQHSTTLAVCGKSFAGNPFKEEWKERMERKKRYSYYDRRNATRGRRCGCDAGKCHG